MTEKHQPDVDITFIAWIRFDRRSELLAEKLGATMHFINVGRRGDVLLAPIRYLIQSLRTWRVSIRERPELIFVQNPPIFCALAVWIYCLLSGSQFVIDSHTAAFLSPRWARFLWLHRFLSRAASLTIVHNDAQEKIVEAWGCRYVVLADPVGGYPSGDPYTLEGEFNVAVISAYKGDEPLDVVFAAAERLPEIDFYITGDDRLAAPWVLKSMPENCHPTGFLPYNRYIGLLRGVDVVVDLTTRNHTLLCGAFEAVSLGKPLVISDWPILQKQFNRGTIHIPNTADGLVAGIEQARQEKSKLESEIHRLGSELRTDWKIRFNHMQRILGIQVD